MAIFKTSGQGEPCLFSLTRSDHVCAGKLERHHLVKQQFLRREFPDQWDVIWSPWIAVNLCDEGAHQPVTRASTRVYRHEVPFQATQFADLNGFLWRLELECPLFSGDRLALGNQASTFDVSETENGFTISEESE